MKAFRVLEKVPTSEPTISQARMHLVPKHDATRRTVDMRSRNKNCGRESRHVVSPFKQERSVPHNTWKMATDAWNGYHRCHFHNRVGKYCYCLHLKAMWHQEMHTMQDTTTLRGREKCGSCNDLEW